MEKCQDDCVSEKIERIVNRMGNVGVANLATRAAKLRGLHTRFTNKPLRLTFVQHLPFQGRQGTSCQQVAKIAILATSFANCLHTQSW